jgi:hypothetical protein
MLIIGCDFHTRYQQIGGWHIGFGDIEAPRESIIWVQGV